MNASGAIKDMKNMGKKKKKVGFATSSNTGFSMMSGSEQQVMRTRPILSDEHE